MSQIDALRRIAANPKRAEIDAPSMPAGGVQTDPYYRRADEVMQVVRVRIEHTPPQQEPGGGMLRLVLGIVFGFVVTSVLLGIV